MEYLNRILLGDCEDILKALPDNSVDLIFTSPPYADQRLSTYGGVGPDEYVDWFLPKAAQFQGIWRIHSVAVLRTQENL